MACERFAGTLTAHAAGAQPTRDLREHLERCDECRRSLARERELVGAVAGDLADALRVDPSADFRAKVRQRIAEDVASAGSRAWFGRWQVGLASAALLAAAAVVTVFLRPQPGALPPPDASSQRPPASVSQPVREEVAGPAPAVNDRVAVAPLADNERPHAVRPVRRPARPSEPEVLVQADQARAIALLLDMFRTGKIAPSALTAEEQAAAPAALAIAPIVVEELKVPPIDVVAGNTSRPGTR